MNTSNDYTIDVLNAIARCHRRLQQHAIKVNEFSNCLSVKHVVDTPDLNDSYRYEEYVDAELQSGNAVCWCIEITVFKSCFGVEADVRRTYSGGQDTIESIADLTVSHAPEFFVRIEEIVGRLCDTMPAEMGSRAKEMY